MKRTVFIAGICAAALPVLSDSVLAQQTAPARSPKQAGKGPLKVFILAGQSNMEGKDKNKDGFHQATAARNLFCGMALLALQRVWAGC
jgi:hypothetical protein